MSRMNRFLAQVIIWVVFTFLLWNFSDQDSEDYQKIIFPLFFQIIIVAMVVYFVSYQLFVKRQILLVTLSTLVLVLGFSWFITLFESNPNQIQHRPPFDMPNHEHPPGGDRFEMDFPEGDIQGMPPHDLPPPRPPGFSLFWNMALLFSTTFSLSIFWESTVFAMRKEEETIKNKSEHVQTELRLLKSQINPHFLFNSLNNIYALSVMDSEKTQQSISYLSDMLRYVLYECDQPMVPLKKEVNYIQNYIKLFSLKSSKPFNIITTLDCEDQNVLIAPMLFIPFIENAIKHGNIEERNESFIHINITSAEGNVFFQVENSVSKTQKEKDEFGGIGVENVKKRLEFLYPGNHELRISNKPELFTIGLTLQPGNHV